MWCAAGHVRLVEDVAYGACRDRRGRDHGGPGTAAVVVLTVTATAMAAVMEPQRLVAE